MQCLAAEAIEGAALALERVDNVHGGHGLMARVLSVGHGVTDHVLEENLEHRTRCLVDEAGDALDSATTRQTADGRLGDALDVVAQHLAVTEMSGPRALGAAVIFGHFHTKDNALDCCFGSSIIDRDRDNFVIG